MTGREGLDPQSTGTPVPLDEECLAFIRDSSRKSGIPAAEILRNIMAADGIEANGVTFDGVTVFTPDFDAELAALIDTESHRDDKEG